MLNPPIIVYSLVEALVAAAAASELDVPLVLHSAPGAGAYAGIGWFERLVTAVRAEFPDVAITAMLDCGDAADAVLAALRWLKEPERAPVGVCFTGDPAVAERLAEMAAAIGVPFVRELPPGLDLRSAADPLAASRTWLAPDTAGPR